MRPPASYRALQLTQRTDPLWERIRGQRLFLTGGSGLFGQWLLDSLRDANQRLGLGVEAIVLSRRAREHEAVEPPDSGIRWVQGDVIDFRLPGERFDLVLHMAGTSAAETFAGASALAKLDTLYLGARSVCHQAAQSGAGRLLMTSSGAAYGAPIPLHVRERDGGAHDTRTAGAAWGLGKCVAENLCFQAGAAAGIGVVVARCFSFVGPGLPLGLHYAVGNFIRDGITGHDIVVQGDGTPLRSYLFMADTVVWLLRLLLDGESNEIYNVGSDVPVSIEALARGVCELTGAGSAVKVMGRKDLSVGVPPAPAYVPSIEKARSGLGLEVFTPLDEALAKTIQWARAS